MPRKIVKGDEVAVIAGAQKGKRGKVARVIDAGERVVVHGVNLVKRHARPSQKNPQGGITEHEAPIHISNVMLIDPSDDRPARVGFERTENGWVRVSRRTGAQIPYGSKG